MASFVGVTLAGAFLLFLVQPLVARQVLPWFGGAQSVWTLCLLFYQTMLLGGYLYAHLGERWGARRQALLHAALLMASLALLPITASERWKPTDTGSPTLALLGLLLTTVGGPYLMLSTTAPLVQRWFGRTHPGRSPYPLYAVSNVGSLAALLAYPLAVEPLLAVSRQSAAWSWGYAAFALACGVLALRVARASASWDPTDAPHPAAPPLAAATVALWLALAGCGSGLLLALTNHMTMDVASVPFLWVLPLALYLTTYIVAFAGRYRRGIWGALLVLGLCAMAVLWDVGFALPLAVQLATSSAVLFTACMVCHGELARSTPPASRLTAFYLSIALGGALGGALVALAAPALLPDLWEVPGFLVLAYALLAVVVERERGLAAPGLRRDRLRWAAHALVVVAATTAFILPSARLTRGTVETRRGFYGVLRVQDTPRGLLAGQRVLRVGRIFHGGQFLDPARAREPTAYYTRGSGVGLAIDRHPRRRGGRPLSIGVIGLGVGTLAAFAEHADAVRFYEINPDVETLSRRWFTFLGDSEAPITVALGDGRLTLERELASAAPPRYDVLVVDAFSGDAVPVHLLTREAGDLYARALAEDGVLAFNVTNRHLDLEPVVRGLASSIGRAAVLVRTGLVQGSGGAPSSWMLVTSNRRLIEAVRPETSPASDRTVLWTDDRSDLLRVLR